MVLGILGLLLLVWLHWPRKHMCSECFGYAIEPQPTGCYCFDCQKFTDMMRVPGGR